MRIVITHEGDEPHEADQAELAGSPHRQVSHVLVALSVGATIVLTAPNDQTPIHIIGLDPIVPPPFLTTTYRSVDDELNV